MDLRLQVCIVKQDASYEENEGKDLQQFSLQLRRHPPLLLLLEDSRAVPRALMKQAARSQCR